MGQLLRLFLVLALTAPVVVACGDDDDDDDDDTTGDGDADSDSDSDTDSDADGDGDGDGDGDADACANPDPCDVYEQCGCEAGQNCTFVNDAKQCVPAATGQQDEACSDQGLCDVGFTCLSDNTCAQYCSDRVRCPGGATCSIQLGDAEGNPLAMVCATPSNCDALAGTGCENDYACYISNPSDGTTDCAAVCGDGTCPDGEGEVGDTCESTNACLPGATCLSVDQVNYFCFQHCDSAADPTTCPEATTCQDLPAEGTLGLCIPDA